MFGKCQYVARSRIDGIQHELGIFVIQFGACLCGAMDNHVRLIPRGKTEITHIPAQKMYIWFYKTGMARDKFFRIATKDGDIDTSVQLIIEKLKGSNQVFADKPGPARYKNPLLAQRIYKRFLSRKESEVIFR